MKKLGVIGGAGPLASALFYETLVHESYRLGRPMPEMILLNYPFNRGLTPQDSQENGALVRKELLHCLHALEIAGAELGVLVCNTLHLELAKAPQGNVPFMKIPDLVVREIREKKEGRLLLLATQNTCASSLYHYEEGTIILPQKEEQKIVDEVIDHVLEGTFSEEDSMAIEKLIHLFSDQVDGVILGCTDLPVLHHYFPIRSQKAIYDSVKISAKTIARSL